MSSVSNLQDVDATSKLCKSQTIRYTIKIKGLIRKSLKELIEWTDLFDVSYFLVAVEPNQLITQRLASLQQAKTGTIHLNVIYCRASKMKYEIALRLIQTSNFFR